MSKKRANKKDEGVAIPMGDGKFLVAPSLAKVPKKQATMLRALERECSLPERQFRNPDFSRPELWDSPKNPQTKDLFEALLPEGEAFDSLLETGSAIPYYTSMIGDMLVNPSTVDILTYKKMMETDDTIFHALDYNGSSIVNSIGAYTHKNKDIEKVINHTFAQLKRGFSNLVKDMTMAVGLGFSAHSLKWEYDERIKGNTIVDALPLPQSTIQFRVTPEGHIKENGVGQYVYNAYLQNLANMASLGWWGAGMGGVADTPFPLVPARDGLDSLASGGDLDYPLRLPWYSPVGLVWLKEKNVMIHTHYGTSAQMNPYGKSTLRAVYTLWLRSVALQQFQMVALDRRSFPLLVVYASQTAPVADVNTTNPAAPLQQSRNALQAGTEFFADVNSCSTIVLPGMPGQIYQVEPVKIEGDMTFFTAIEKDLNERKKITLGVPTMVSASGDGASYALAYMHGQSNSRMVASGRKDILNSIISQFIKPIIIENFTEDEHEFDWGKFEDQQISSDERIKNATLYESGIRSGVLFPSYPPHLNAMLEGLGFPRIDSDEEIATLRANALEEMEQLRGQPVSTSTQPSGEKRDDRTNRKRPADKRDKDDITKKPYSHRGDVS